MADLGTCCVDDCDEVATHTFVWTLAANGWGEISVEGIFCCPHYDGMLGHRDTIVDLRIVGSERGPLV